MFSRSKQRVKEILKRYFKFKDETLKNKNSLELFDILSAELDVLFLKLFRKQNKKNHKKHKH